MKTPKEFLMEWYPNGFPTFMEAHDCYEFMEEYVKLVCEEQKKICLENLKTQIEEIIGGGLPDSLYGESILNAPLPKFEL